MELEVAFGAANESGSRGAWGNRSWMCNLGSGSWKWINFDIYDVGIKCLNCVPFAAHQNQEQWKCCKSKGRALHHRRDNADSAQRHVSA